MTTAYTNSNELSTEAHELMLFADNTSELYPQFKSIITNLSRKMVKGTYDPNRAPKLWRYWTDAAAIQYKKEFGYQFTPAVRQELALALALRERDNILNGEYAEPCDRCPNVDNGYTAPGISFFGLDPKTGGTTLAYCDCECGRIRRGYWDAISGRSN